MKKAKILIVDDEAGIRDSLNENLMDEGYDIYLAKDAVEAREIQKKENLDIILLDIWMPDCDGISLLKEWKKNNNVKCPVIMMSGHGTIDTAIEATKIGAFDFLEKPISLQKLLKTVSNCLKATINISKLNRSFIDSNEQNFIKEYRNRLSEVKNEQVICIDGPEGNFLNIIIDYLVENDFYKLQNESVLDNSLIHKIQAKGKNNLLVSHYKKLSNFNKKELKELLDVYKKNNIRIVFADVRINIFNSLFDEDVKLKKYYISLPIGRDPDMIPEYAKSILDFYLTENLNLGYKSFDTSALNTLRLNSNFLNIDTLDNCISMLVQQVSGELILAEDVNSHINKLRATEKKAIENNNVELDTEFYSKNLKEAREDFEKKYFNYHIGQGKSVSDLAKVSGIERTHLYRKLKQLGLKNK